MSTTNTITMNTSDLHDITLNWAVAQCEGAGHWAKPEKFVDFYSKPGFCKFTRDWSLAGEIIEREWINLTNSDDVWRAEIATDVIDGYLTQYGQSPLEAAMRVYVKLKLGDTVEVPAVVFEAMGVSA